MDACFWSQPSISALRYMQSFARGLVIACMRYIRCRDQDRGSEARRERVEEDDEGDDQVCGHKNTPQYVTPTTTGSLFVGVALTGAGNCTEAQRDQGDMPRSEHAGSQGHSGPCHVVEGRVRHASDGLVQGIEAAHKVLDADRHDVHCERQQGNLDEAHCGALSKVDIVLRSAPVRCRRSQGFRRGRICSSRLRMRVGEGASLTGVGRGHGGRRRESAEGSRSSCNGVGMDAYLWYA